MNTPAPKDIFSEALELSESQRETYLRNACSGDDALRDRILALLSAADRNGSFLGAAVIDSLPVHSSQHSATLDEDVGSQIGPYELIELLGEGGFGSVFRAHQASPVQRDVALKVIKLGMDTRAVVARFEQERQTLAILDHPNIAKVLDAGATRSGRPYFVMELVHGSPITIFSDQHALGIDARLDLFIQVCQAVQHAHTKGIIHRDLKPGNVLVTTTDGQPFAKVIDFGIAKATTADAALTLTGPRHLAGTPHYMSPEQARGSIDIDTRSDVYSLGVLLYELLTGCTPFDASTLGSVGFVEMQRILREDDPPTPSSRLTHDSGTLSSIANARGTMPARLAPLLRGELDWVVMRALEKDRTDRYASPGELAADLRRHLTGEAVLAAPHSRTYRLRKAITRHRTASVAAVAIVASLVLGLGAALWQASVADALRAKAEERRHETEQVASFQAEQLRGLDPATMGARLRNDLIAEVTLALSHSNLAPKDIQARQDQLASLLAEANFTDLSLRVLDSTIFDRALTTIDQRFQTQPLLKAELLVTIADTMRDLGLFKNALAPLDEALAIRQSLLGPDHEGTIASLLALARLHWSRGEMDLAENSALEASRRALRARGDEDALTLDARNTLGMIYQVRSKFDQSEPIFRDTLEKRRRTLGLDHIDSIRSLTNLAYCLGTLGRLDDAEPYYKESLDRFRRVLGDEHLDTIKAMHNYGMALRLRDRLGESEALLRTALALRTRLRGGDHVETLTTTSLLATTLDSMQRPQEAEQLYRAALDGYRRTVGNHHALTLETMGNTGEFLRKIGQPVEAEALLRESLTGKEQQFGAASLTASITRNNLAQLFLDQRRYVDAERLYLYAQQEIEKLPNASATKHSFNLTKLCSLYESWDQDQPRQGYDAKATAIRARLDALPGAPAPH